MIPPRHGGRPHCKDRLQPPLQVGEVPERLEGSHPVQVELAEFLDQLVVGALKQIELQRRRSGLTSGDIIATDGIVGGKYRRYPDCAAGSK